MDIKKNILKKITGVDEDIHYMISHHMVAYLGVIIMSVIGIVILFFLYKLICMFSIFFAVWVVGVLWVILYVYIIFEFIDIYLDAILITSSSIIIYKWYWVLKTTTDIIALHAVESVYSGQSGLIDTVFNRWDIVIRRAWHENIFDSVYSPGEVANNINQVIDKFSKTEQVEEENEEQEDNFQIFVEAMAEVIKEYKWKR